MLQLTCAAARVHIGILFSSVKMLKRSSAEAMKVASTETRAVLIVLSSTFFTGFEGTAVAAFTEAGIGVEVPVFGVEAPDTVRSPPCVVTIAEANVENMASRAGGNFALARAKTASTAGERAVLRDHSYCYAMGYS